MPQNHYSQFKQLHFLEQPLLLANVWDAASAAIVQQAGAQAMATSSAAVSWTLGYKDASELPKALLLQAIKNILSVCQVPLSVDIEAGYSDDSQTVATLVSELIDLGVAGINIEDGSLPVKLLEEKIRAIRTIPNGENIFINARTDVFLRQLTPQEQLLAETQKRLKQYLAAGADGGFVPSLLDLDTINALSESINMPINIMLSGNGVTVSQLHQAGAQRISSGPGSFLHAYSALHAHAKAMLNGSFEQSIEQESEQPIAQRREHALTFAQLNELF